MYKGYFSLSRGVYLFIHGKIYKAQKGGFNMNEEIIKRISHELKITEEQIQNTLSMLEEGNTVPFIARYRKEPVFRVSHHGFLELSI